MTERRAEVQPSEWVDHPWAGDDEGHNCVDCIAAGDDLHQCWWQAHVVPRWEDDKTAKHFGCAHLGCGICGATQHTKAEHLAGHSPGAPSDRLDLLDVDPIGPE